MAKIKYSFLHPERRRSQTKIDEGSITQSEFAKELDINYLVERHMKAGIPFPVAKEEYSDVSTIGDFQQAQDAIVRAREAWYQIPAKTRRHFGDKIENFLSALHDPERYDELVKLKIYKKRQDNPAREPVVPQGGEAPAKPEGGGKPPGTVST